MLVAIKFLLMVLILASCITIKFKIKQEKSILITFLSIILFIYILGLFNIMVAALYIIGILDVLGIGYIIYSIIKKNVKLSEIFTVGTVVYICISLLLGIILKDTYFTVWDEFSHWGPNLKAMVSNDLFWANNKYDGIHVVYQPLAGLVEYLFCKLNGQFFESIAYLGIDIGIVTLLLPVLKNFKYNVKDIIKAILFVFCIFSIIFIFNFSLTSIYIDLILGIMFAMGMYIAIDIKKFEDKILLILILISMVELKTTGMLLDGIILMVLFFKKILIPIIKERKITKKICKKFFRIICLLILMLMAYVSWNTYCKANNRVLDRRHDNNFISQINIQEFISAITQNNCNNQKLNSISISFYQALNGRSIIKGFPFSTCIQLLAFLNVIMIILYVKKKDKNEKINILVQILGFNIGFVLYCLLLIGTYMYAFTDAEGLGLASFERYMTTYFIAWVINMIIYFFKNEEKIDNMKKTKSNKSSLFMVLIVSIVCLYASNIQTLIHPIAKKNSTIPEYIQQKADIVTSKLNSNDKVYVIFQNPGYSIDPFVFRYCISPVVMNLMDEYSLGKLDSPTDHLTLNITEQEWEQKLIDENYDYVFILRSDDEFIETYKDAFEENTDFENFEDKIFKVNKIDDNNVILNIYEEE